MSSLTVTSHRGVSPVQVRVIAARKCVGCGKPANTHDGGCFAYLRDYWHLRCRDYA